MLRPNSRFREAADIWMGKIRERRADSTADTYTSCLDNQVLPAARRAASRRVRRRPARRLLHPPGTRPQGRRAARRIDGREAPVRGQHPPDDPRDRRRRHAAGRPPPGRRDEPRPRPGAHRVAEGPPQGAPTRPDGRGTPALLAFVDTDKTAIRADLPDLIRFALGSGLRIGEICARPLDGPRPRRHPGRQRDDMRLVPVVAVRQNVYPVKGKGLVGARRQDRHGAADRPATGVRDDCSCGPGSTPTTTRRGRCSPPPAATAGRPTAGPRTSAGACEPCARRSGWTG